MKNIDERASGEAAQTQIRAFEEPDLPAVADLFQATFCNPKNPAPPALRAYLGDLFLSSSLNQPDIRSLVYVDETDGISGFIGVLPTQLTFEGRPVRAAIAGSLMVADPAKHPFAGARLLKAYLAGPQDLSLSETANTLSAGMWKRLGHEPIAGYSLDWFRILRPAGFGVAALAKGFRPAQLLSPLARVIDAAGNRIAANPFPPRFERRGLFKGADACDDDLIAFIPQISEQFAVHPDWDHVQLRRMLDHAAQKSRFGKPVKRIVHDKRGAPVGCYIYYARPRGIAWVLQFLARPDASTAVLQDLLSHANEQGCIAVRGRTHPGYMNAFLLEASFFFPHSATIAHARDPRLLAAIKSGDAFVTGLAAEVWTRLIGDEFD